MTGKEREEAGGRGTDGLFDPLIRCISHRRSVRSFQPTPIADEVIRKIMEAGRWAPSGGNSQPWEFIVVKRRETLEKIGRIFVDDREQRIREQVNFPGSAKAYIAGVPAMIVVVADPRWKQAYPGTDFSPALRRMYAKNRELIFVQSVAAAVENMFLAAASLGVGMAWLTGFAEDRMGRKLRRLLQVPEPVRLMAGLPIGYPKALCLTKFRRPLEDLVHSETYDPGRLKTDEFFRNFCDNERNRVTYTAGVAKR
jgi:nitroreductase